MKMIYLCPRYWYLHKMSRVRFHQIQAIGNLIEMVWSGPGWDNYDNNQAVEENIQRLYGDHRPDMIIVFDMDKNIKGLCHTSIPTCMIMNEMHDPLGSKEAAYKMLVESCFDFIVCHHLNEMNHPVFNSLKGKMVNISHCANKEIFKDYNLKKDTDVLLCGSLRLEKYQLRRKFVSVIDRLIGLGYKAKVHESPNGIQTDAFTNRYLIDFAKAINSSRICLTCSSIYKCAFGKYVEIPMCRSLLAGDLPDERHEFFEQFMLVIDPDDTEDQMVAKIVSCLEGDDIVYRTNLGFNLSQDYGMDSYANKFIEAASLFLKKRQRKIYL